MVKKISVLIFIFLCILTVFSFEKNKYVTIKVLNRFGETEFNEELKIDENYNINIPIIGTICLKNLDKKQLENLIYSKLNPDYIINPTVLIDCDTKKTKFTITGYVKKPGTYEIEDKKLTLYDAINQAGGFLPEADKYNVLIKKGTSYYSYNIQNFIEDGLEEENPVVEKNDVIIVKRAKLIYVIGEVNDPFKTYYSEKEDVISLVLTAGITKRSALKYAKIIRRNKNGTFKTINVNLNDILKKGKISSPLPKLLPGDIIFIPKTSGSRFDVLHLRLEQLADIYRDLDIVKFLHRELF